MAIAPQTRSAVSFVRDHALTASLALAMGGVAVFAATTGTPWLVDYLFIVGSICGVAGIALFVLGYIDAYAALVMFVGGGLIGMLPVMLPGEPAPPMQVEARPSVVRSDPPILIDAATGCEWIGTNWSRATPRIGPDGATICNGKSTGKAAPKLP